MTNQGVLLQQARKRNRMSQAMLAGAASVSERTVARAERNQPINDENLRSICSVLGLDATALPHPQPSLATEPEAAHVAPAAETTHPVSGPGAAARFSWLSRRASLGHRSVRLTALACALALGAASMAAIQSGSSPARDQHFNANNPRQHEDADFTSWLTDTLPQVMSMDFLRWQSQQEDASVAFSAAGWQDWEKERKRFGIDYALDLRSVVATTITGPASIHADGINRLSATLPVLITRETTSTRTPLHAVAEVSVRRMDGSDGQPHFRIVAFHLREPAQQSAMPTEGGLAANEATDLLKEIARETEAAILAAHQYDPARGDGQFGTLEQSFTREGWQNWKQALLASGNISFSKSNNTAMNAATTGPVSFIGFQTLRGVPTWRFRIALTLNYGAGASLHTQPLLVEAEAQRDATSGTWLLSQILESPA